jgi:hypothetical protein
MCQRVDVYQIMNQINLVRLEIMPLGLVLDTESPNGAWRKFGLKACIEVLEPIYLLASEVAEALVRH